MNTREYRMARCRNLLRRAKKYLKVSSCDTGVCVAVDRALMEEFPAPCYPYEDYYQYAADEIHNYIREALEFGAFVYDWLYYQGVHDPEPEALYQYRLRWIDHMVKEVFV